MEKIDFDPLTGLGTFVDVADGKMCISHRMDSTPVLESNQESQKNPDLWKQGVKESFVKVATIPADVQLAWLSEGIDLMNPDHWEAVRRKLNDPDWRKVRTTLSRV